MFVTANMGLALAMTVAAALYALLTFVLKCEVAPVKRRSVGLIGRADRLT